MSAKIPAIVVGACLALSGVAVATFSTEVQAQQKEKDSKALNPKVGAPLQAALTAAKNKQFDAALAEIKKAEAEKKTSYEQYKINETLAFIYAGQKKFTELAGVYEKMLETPQFLADPSQINAKVIAQLYASA